MRVSRETEQYSKRNLPLGGLLIKMFVPCPHPTVDKPSQSILMPHS